MGNLIKENLKPVTQGTIGSLVATALLWLMLAAISLVTTVSARSNGMALYKAILIGGLLFAFLAGALNLLARAISRYRVGTKGNLNALEADQARHAATIEELNETISRLSREKQKIADSRSQVESQLERIKNSYEWLHHIAENEKIGIDNFVVLTKYQSSNLNLTDAIPSVRFGLYITNNSVLDISVDNQLGGFIRFDGHDLLDKKRVLNEIRDAGHGTTACLTIEQRLTPSEVKAISEAQAEGSAVFDLKGLTVVITGGSNSPEVIHRPLKMEGVQLPAFPRSFWEIAQSVHALGRIRGGGSTLWQRLRMMDEALPQSELENWKEGARRLLEHHYGEVRAVEMFRKIFTDPVPDENAFQSQWLHDRLNYLEYFFDREIKEISTLQRAFEDR